MVEDTDINAPGVAPVVRPLSDVSTEDAAVAWAMVEASPDALVVADEDGVIELVNQQAEALFGYDRVDLLGRPVEMLLPEKLAHVHSAHRTRFRVAPEVRSMGSGLDLSARRADGSEVPVEVSLSPMRVHGQLRVIAAVRDISDRVNAEAESKLIRDTIDAAHDGVFMFPAEGAMQFTYVNRGATVQTGYSRDELLSMSPLHIKPLFTRESFLETVGPLAQGDVSHLQFETVHRRKDGVDVPVEILLEYPAPAKPGARRVMVALVRDITERVKAEQEALIVQHSINSVSDAVFVCDEHTLEFVHVNRGAVDLHGYTQAELLNGMSPLDLAPNLPPDELANALRAMESSPERSVQMVTKGVSKNGDVLSVDVRIDWPAPASPSARRPVVAVVRDVTAEVEADAVRQRQEALVAVLAEVRLAMLGDMARADGLRLICERVQETLEAAAVLVVTPTGAGSALEIEADAGLDANARSELSFPPGAGAVGEVLSTGQAQLLELDDPRIQSQNRVVVERAGTGSIVIAALPGGDETFGVLIVTRASTAAPLADRDLVAIEQFAAAAAVTIELAEVRATQNRLDVLEDRDRIGRDMHDKVIGRLFATGMSMQSAMARFDDPAVRDWLAGTVDEIDDAIKEIRTTVYGLRSAIDWGKGVRGDILALAADQAAALGFEPRVNLVGPIDDLAAHVVQELLATMRESFTNAAKHANAKSVSVLVAVDKAGLRLRIEDDGVGFSAEQPVEGGCDHAGNGLRNMTTRAEDLGGVATIVSSPGVGTTLEWAVPVQS